MIKSIICACAILLVGCGTSCESSDEFNKQETSPFKVVKQIDEVRSLVCDQRTGLVYIRYTGFFVAGLTEYLDGTLNQARCAKR